VYMYVYTHDGAWGECMWITAPDETAMSFGPTIKSPFIKPFTRGFFSSLVASGYGSLSLLGSGRTAQSLKFTPYSGHGNFRCQPMNTSTFLYQLYQRTDWIVSTCLHTLSSYNEASMGQVWYIDMSPVGW